MSATSVQGLISPLSLQPGPRLIDGADIATIIQTMASGKGGLTALAGGGLPGATPCTAYINEFTTTATTNDSCVLPPAIPGLEVTVINSGAQTLRCYGNGNNPGNGNAADTIIPLAGGAGAAFIAIPAAAVSVFSCATIGRWKSQLV